MKCSHFFALLILLSLNITLYSQNDKEFWFVAPDITDQHGDEPLYIRVTAFDEDAEVTISMPANNGFKAETFTVKKNSQYRHKLDEDEVENFPVNSINNKGIFIESTENVSVYYEVANQGNPDKFTLKGENALGKEFFVVSQDDYQNWTGYNGDANEKADIVATEDNTVVTIIPKVNITGHTADVPYTINLNKGQTYCIEYRDIGHNASLAGTYINADKDIAVTISDDSVNESSHPHDLIGDQMIPTSVIGYEYIAVKTSDQTNATQKVYVLATEDNTHIFIDGDNSKVASLNKGELKSFHITNHAIHIRGTKPIYAYQLCGLVNVNGNGTANELGSALLPTIECTGSSFVSFTRIFARLFWVQILAKEKDLNYFVMRDENNNVVDDINNLSWHKVAGTDSGSSDDTWYSAIIDLNITTGVPYTIQNTNGLFHLSVLDENDPSSGPGSVSYGYFSSYGRMKLQGPTQECVGNAIELSSSVAMDSYNWFSTLSNGTIISTDPSIKVTESGRYWLTAETKLGGCEITDSIDVDFMLPEVDLGDDVEVCPGETVSLTTQAGYQNYNWSNNATGNSTTVTTSIGSSETISVEVTDELGCSNSDEVKIDALPLPIITLNTTTVCDGQKVINNSIVDKYEWVFEGEILNIDSDQNFIIPEKSGIYTLTVWNDLGCSTSQDFTITVNSLPIITDFNKTLCDGEIATFSAPTGTGYSYEWHDGSTNSTLVLNTPAKVSLNVIDNLGCEATADGELKWYEPSNIDLGNDIEQCENTSVSFVGDSNFTNYSWSLTNAGVESALPNQSPEHIQNILDQTVNSNGIYKVNALDLNGCPASGEVALEYVNTPKPVIQGGELCEGGTLELTANLTGYSYQWYKNGALISGEINRSLIISEGGSYYVEIDNRTCKQQSDVRQVIVRDNPTVTLTSDFTICEQTSAQIKIDVFSNPSGGAFDYLVWQNSGVTDSDINSVLNVNASDITDPSNTQVYDISVTDVYGCSAEASTVVTKVAPITFSLTDEELCVGTSIILSNTQPSLLSYQWYKREASGDIPNAAGANTNMNVTNGGTYVLKVKDANNCDAEASLIVHDLELPVVNLGSDVKDCPNEVVTLAIQNPISTYQYKWSDNSSNATLTYTIADNSNEDISVEVTDNKGCKNSDVVNVSAHELPKISLNKTTVCEQQRVECTEPASSYEWTFKGAVVSTQSWIEPQETGDYTLTVTNEAGCSISEIHTITVNPLPTVALSDAIVCYGDAYTFNAPAGNYNYKWSDNSTGSTYTMNDIGEVELTVIDKSTGCEASDKATLSYYNPTIVDLGPDSEECEGIDLTIEAPDNLTNYEWKFKATGSTTESNLPLNAITPHNQIISSVSSVNSGTYLLYATDNNGCPVTSSKDVLVHDNPQVTIIGDDLCAGEEIELIASGKYDTYEWSLDGSPLNGVNYDNKNRIQIKVKGEYAVQAGITVGSVTCTKQTKFPVEERQNPTVSLIGDVNICDGTDSELLPDFTKGTGDFEYLVWQDEVRDEQITARTVPAQNATYSVTAFDEYGCSDFAEVETVNISPLSLNLNNIDECENSTVNLQQYVNDLPIYTSIDSYKWYYAQSNIDEDVVDETSVSKRGTYRLEVIDNNSCEVQESLVISDLPLPAVSLGDDVKVCPGEKVTLVTTGGYDDYSWNYPAGVGNVSQVEIETAVGFLETVSVEVTDNNNCVAKDDVLVETYSLPSITFNTNTVCLGQIVENTQPAVKYEWEYKGVVINSDKTQNWIAPTESGEYTHTVWNAEGCSYAEKITITVNQLPTIALLDEQKCYGESHTFNGPTGDYTYKWTSNLGNASSNSDFTLTTVDQFQLQVVDKNTGCESVANGSLQWLQPMSINLGDDIEQCENTDVTFLGDNNYTNYSWALTQNGTVTTLGSQTPNYNYSITDKTVNSNGIYKVEAIDPNGCPVSDEVELEYINTPKPLISGGELCDGGSVILKADQAGYTYQWYKDGNIMSGYTGILATVTEAGEYHVEMGNRGCKNQSDKRNVIKQALPTVNLSNDFIICDETEATITVSSFNSAADFDYLVWSSNGVRESNWQTASLKIAASDITDASNTKVYSVEAYDKNGCFNQAQTTVTKVLPVSLSLTDVSECGGIMLNLNNYVTYSPITPSVVLTEWFKEEATGLVPVIDHTNVSDGGVFSIKVEDSNGCIIEDQLSINRKPIPDINLGDDVDICADSYTISVDDIYNIYEWNNDPLLNTHQLEVVTSGTNILKVTDLNGCVASDDVDITLKQLPVVALDYTQACAGEDMYLSVSGSSSNTYFWSTGEATSSIKVTPGTYWLDAINIEGCTTRVEESVNWFLVPKVSLGPDVIVCPMLSLEALDAGSGYASYLWHTGDRTQMIYPTILDTVNMVTVSDANGCSGFATKSVKHEAYEGPKLISDTTVCEFEIIQLDAGPDFISYKWNDGDESQLKTIEEAGQYIVEVSDACYIHTDTANIVHYESPVIARLDTSIYAQVVVFAEGGRIPYTYTLNDDFPQNENVFKSLENGDYTVYVIDRNGCTAENAFSLNNVFDIEVPSFFTPNNDGINDRWEIDGIDRFPDSIIKIYDRFGKLLIKYKASAPGWDGRYLGQPVKTDDYWYVVELVEVKKALKGHFTLKR